MKTLLTFLILMLFIVPSHTWNKFNEQEKQCFLQGCVNQHEKKFGFHPRNWTVTKKGKNIIIDVRSIHRQFNIWKEGIQTCENCVHRPKDGGYCLTCHCRLQDRFQVCSYFERTEDVVCEKTPKDSSEESEWILFPTKLKTRLCSSKGGNDVSRGSKTQKRVSDGCSKALRLRWAL